MGIKHIHGSTTSLNGCKIDVDGDIEYSLIPPRFIGFLGTVHLSGDKEVPNGDLYFGIEPKGGKTTILSVGERKP